MSQPNLNKLAQTYYRTIESDGLTVAAVGLLLLAVGALLHTHLAIVPVFAVPLAMVPAITQLRSRFTYPRVGYAKPIVDAPGRQMRGIITFCLLITAVLIAVLFAIYREGMVLEAWRRWMPVWLALCLSGAGIHSASRAGSISPLLVAGALVAVAVGFCLSPAAHYLVRLQWYMLTIGGLLCIGGLVVFALFVARHPAVEEEGVDGQQ